MKIAACGKWVWEKETDPAVLLPWFAGGMVRGGIEVKRNARRAVYRVTAQNGKDYFAKLEQSPCLLLRNKAKIEFKAGRMLREADIPCVEFAACGRRGLHETLLVSRAEENTVDAREYFFSVAAADPLKRKTFLEALFALLRKMKEKGIRHRDFHAGNILVREESNGDCMLLLVDPLAVSRSTRADAFELARILNDFAPLLTEEEALALAENNPELLARIVQDRKEKCRREWDKRKNQILSGNSKFSRTVQLENGRVLEIASTPWYKPGILPEDLSSLAVEICSAEEAEFRWLEMFRARLGGRRTPYCYLVRENCGAEVRLYRREKM